MYHVKMAFVLVQVASNMWINPMQLQGIGISPNCGAILLVAGNSYCSDWPIEKVKEALAPAAVAKALEGK